MLIMHFLKPTAFLGPSDLLYCFSCQRLIFYKDSVLCRIVAYWCLDTNIWWILKNTVLSQIEFQSAFLVVFCDSRIGRTWYLACMVTPWISLKPTIKNDWWWSLVGVFYRTRHRHRQIREISIKFEIQFLWICICCIQVYFPTQVTKYPLQSFLIT